MSEKLLKSLKNEINAVLNWLRQGKNLLRLFIMAAVLTALAAPLGRALRRLAN